MFTLNLSRKCVLKNICIITFASHSMKENSTKTIFSDLFKCIEQNSVVRLLVSIIVTLFIVTLLNVLWLHLKV